MSGKTSNCSFLHRAASYPLVQDISGWYGSRSRPLPTGRLVTALGRSGGPTARRSDTTRLNLLVAGPCSIDLVSRRRYTADLFAGPTGAAGLEPQQARVFEGVCHSRRDGGRWEGSKALREAGRAVERSRLSAAVEGTIQCFSREVLVVYTHISTSAPPFRAHPLLGRLVEHVTRHLLVGSPEVQRLDSKPMARAPGSGSDGVARPAARACPCVGA